MLKITPSKFCIYRQITVSHVFLFDVSFLIRHFCFQLLVHKKDSSIAGSATHSACRTPESSTRGTTSSSVSGSSFSALMARLRRARTTSILETRRGVWFFGRICLQPKFQPKFSGGISSSRPPLSPRSIALAAYLVSRPPDELASSALVAFVV